MRDSEADGRVIPIVGLVVSGALLCLIWAVTHLPPPVPARTLLYPLLVTTLVAVANGWVIRTEIRSAQSVSTTSAAVLVGVTILPAPWLVLCTAVGIAVAQAVVRLRPVKAAFAIGKETITATAASAAAGWAGAHPVLGSVERLDSLRTILIGLGAAALAYAAVDETVALPVLALANRTPWWQVLRRGVEVRIAVKVVTMLLAAATIGVIAVDARLLIATPLVVLLLHSGYSRRLHLREERLAWRRLAETTDALNSVDLDSVLGTAVRGAADLFSAQYVAVELGPPGRRRLVRGDGTGIRYDGPADAAPPADSRYVAIPFGAENAGDGRGELRLGLGAGNTLSDREQYTLRTFAAALSTAIRNATAYEEVTRLAAQHAHDAAHDPLTGLANRRQLHDRLAGALSGRGGRSGAALLLIDLNHFKEINDTLGHGAGDRVLVEVADRLRTVASGALVARLGGDEFAVLFPGVAPPARTEHRARQVLSVLRTPMDLDGVRVSVGASAGLATAGTASPEELLRRADVAMYQAKDSGHPLATYARGRDTADLTGLALGGEVSGAVAAQQFVVGFAPTVDLSTGRVIAAEAVASWDHPDLGPLAPGRFLALVERSGLLGDFTRAVLDESLAAVRAWQDAGFDLPVAVTVSPRSLLDPTFPAQLLDRLERHRVAAERLVVDLVDTTTIGNLDTVVRVLMLLRDAGVRIALDDLGAPRTSLSALFRLPVHQAKIHHELVAAVSGAPSAALRSLVELGRSLNLTVIAGGLENPEHRSLLWELGCTGGQGSLFGVTPLSTAGLLATLRRGFGGVPGALAPTLHPGGSVVRLAKLRRIGSR
ncbi:EAL domain-containing protein [Micromonospora sp. NPDC049559]|uniref:putative bifunctional diguanylate cyclase/phosphodiesterase n=1 Tax=Micromonospora sp. NPDC049559 TaxID=3155923 RepID=UPI00343BF0DC